MIRIFDEREQDFTHDGIEVLNPICISCISERELNGTWVLNAKFIRDNDRSNSIQNMRILKVTTPKGEQLFRIVNIKSNKSKINVYAEHIFFDNRYNFIADCYVSKKDGNNALQKILSSCQYTNKFSGTSTIPTIASARLIRKTLTDVLMGGDDNSYLNRWGGEIDFDNFSFAIKPSIGKNRGVEITYGHNMTSFEGEVDDTGVVTRIMPMGYNALLLPEKYIDSPLINNYPFPKVQVFEMQDIKVKEDENDEDEEAFETEEEAFAAMRARVQELFSVENIDKPSLNLKINIISLEKTDQYKNEIFEKVYLGDTLKVNLEKYGFDVTAKIISEKYDCINKRYEELEIGEVKGSILRDVTSMKDKIDGIISDLQGNTWQDFIDKSRDEASKLIAEGVKDSFVVAKKNEILIMDNQDVNSAQKVIRMNKNGIAFSQTGYNGPFVIGITIDGKINADCVTTGTLNANLIRSGRLQSLNGNTWIDLENGHFSLSNESSKVEINNSGVVIKQGALQIKNKNDVTVLSGDDNGDLLLRGSVINGYEGYSTIIQRGGIVFEAQSKKTATIRPTKAGDTGINGISITTMPESEYIDIGYAGDSNDDSNTVYNTILRVCKDSHSAIGGFAGVTCYKDFTLRPGNYLRIGSNNYQSGLIYQTNNGKIGIFGDEGVVIGGIESDGTSTSIISTNKTASNLGTKIVFYGGLNMQGFSINDCPSIGAVGKDPIRISNINTKFNSSGWYSYGADCAGIPSGGPNWGILIHIRAFADDFAQILWGTDNSFRIRWYVNGAYTSWKVW